MRKLLAFFIILISINQLSAQEGVKVFKPFRVDAALGSANSLSAGTSIGFCLSLEPRYAINDVLHVGLRFEGAAIVKGFYDNSSSSQNISGSASGISSYLATGDYYFTTNRFRPYAGAGLGIYDIASAAIDIKDVNQNADYSLAVASLSKFESASVSWFTHYAGSTLSPTAVPPVWGLISCLLAIVPRVWQ